MGNVIGGVGMAALLNHAPLATDLEGATEANQDSVEPMRLSQARGRTRS
jgi:hypothetical protein